MTETAFDVSGYDSSVTDLDLDGAISAKLAVLEAERAPRGRMVVAA